MLIHNFCNFKEAKDLYIERVLFHIHYKKLKKRIKEEIGNHMDDMYGDFKNDFDNEIDVAKKVLDEMGDPDELGLELKEANKGVLRFIKAIKVTTTLSIIPILIFCQTVLYDPIMEIRQYHKAVSIETIEAQMSEKYYDGKPVRLFAEADHDGTVYRYYVPVEQPGDWFEYVHTESITVLGKSCKDKFLYFGRGSHSKHSDVFHFNIGKPYYPDFLYVLTAPTEEKYIRLYFEPIHSDSGLKGYRSDYIEYPQNGTYENPVTFIIDTPDGYRLKYTKEFDENKNEYIPEPTTRINDCDSNGISIHSSTVIH